MIDEQEIQAFAKVLLVTILGFSALFATVGAAVSMWAH